ncbi:hypothetical protein ACFYW8_37650 [Streptomyces sp. NPDC002742]
MTSDTSIITDRFFFFLITALTSTKRESRRSARHWAGGSQVTQGPDRAAK